MTQPAILVLNSGSSSLKFALFAPDALLRGEFSGSRLLAHDGAGPIVADELWSGSPTDALNTVLALAKADIAAIGHRIVHGGPDHIAPERVTPALLDALDAIVPLDPMHMPVAIATIRAMATLRPDTPQIACYDTAFHATMPWAARQFALPRAWSEAGVRRYGFHGLSCESIAQSLWDRVPTLAAGRVIVAHLGAGASLCAMAKGHSIASTFGLGVLDGLMMATRCGALDPGVIFYLARKGMALPDIETMLYDASGLLGVSGISGDMRELLNSQDPRAAQAIDLYTYRLSLEIGAMVSALGGLDGIVFTAGIGTHAPAIRARLCERLAWLGVALDDTANAAGAMRIAAANSLIDLRVIPTDEEAMIARHAAHLLALA